ncbi:zincin [Cylindrobasidium torrendii FP15055 ss-10]|uniref:Zincin n=1 Tax=Cylindrobasidium torrendii FP15055 ss-10 TaxID=1314674 RepID=A0A0D7BBS8_9AGAR|nr:zincin [Cylindrobasidium torrendii FP15055 ss-10]
MGIAKQIALLVSLLAVSVVSRREDPRSVCGNVVSREEFAAAEAHFNANRRVLSKRAGPIEISTVVHIVSNGTAGNVSDELINTQFDLLNDAFNTTDVQFTLTSVTRTDNFDWFKGVYMGSDAEAGMTAALHTGGVETLNIYFADLGGLTGYSQFPWSYTSQPTLDGVFLNYRTLPYGDPDMEGWNEGAMLPHEAGHWVGLYHTFENACSAEGDAVDDTPAEGGAAYFCPENRDTCSSDPGVDPIHNFMDYTDDYCRYEFTAGQGARMADILATYRGF